MILDHEVATMAADCVHVSVLDYGLGPGHAGSMSINRVGQG
jgi:hypothetical protein